MAFADIFDSSLIDYSSDFKQSENNYIIEQYLDKLILIFQESKALHIDFKELRKFFRNHLSWNKILKKTRYNPDCPLGYYINQKMFCEDIFMNDYESYDRWEFLMNQHNIKIRPLNDRRYNDLYDAADLIYAEDEEEFFENGKDPLVFNNGANKYYFVEIVYEKNTNTLLFSLNPYALGGDEIMIKFI